MNITHLAWFCEAFERRSLAKTAENEFVSRQALSKAIKGLEGELGSPLFVRSESGIEPTDEARAIYPLACRIVESRRTMQALCEEIRRQARPRMRIGLGFGVLQALPDGLLVALEKECSDIDFVIEKGFLWDCFEWLECGKVDFALCPGPAPAHFDRMPLVQEEIFLIASSELFEAAARGMAVEEGYLRETPLYTPGVLLPVNSALEQLLSTWGIAAIPDAQYTDFDYLLQKVIAAQGMTAAPRNVVDRLESSDMVVRSLAGVLPPWEVCLFSRSEELTVPERRVRDFFKTRALECS